MGSDEGHTDGPIQGPEDSSREADRLAGLRRAAVRFDSGTGLLAAARGLRRRVQVPGRPSVELTRRQSEVLELLRRGLSTSEIADRLQISSVTVRRHLGLAIDKLAAKDRAAALRALEQAEA